MLPKDRLRPYEKYENFGNVSGGRLFLNKELLPRLAMRTKDGDDILFVGCHKYWDYSPFWNNPARLCNFFTMDTNPGGEDYPVPDYNMSIETCDEMESDRFQQIIMIGVFEYLDHFDDLAVKQIHRMLKPGGQAIFAFTGKGEYDDNRGMADADVYERLKPLRVIENYSIYEGADKPKSVITVAIKT